MRTTLEERIAKLIERGKRLQSRGDYLIKQAAHLDMMRNARARNKNVNNKRIGDL